LGQLASLVQHREVALVLTHHGNQDLCRQVFR
jgi:hypothetical protein